MESITKKLKREQEGARKYNQLENLVYANIKEAQHIATCKTILRHIKLCDNKIEEICCGYTYGTIQQEWCDWHRLKVWLEGEIENGKRI